MRAIKILACIFLYFLVFQTDVYGIENPLSVSNNKFGIHIISPTVEEASEAAQLVNSQSGDWGYVTFVIQTGDRDIGKWQNFFNTLRRKHLIPIIRLATKPVKDYWEMPPVDEAKLWAEFLDQLNWPIKNRYVVVYNEPNHAKEWGNAADPASYARALNDTINELKAKSRDFYILNAGFDASAPHQPPNYYDAGRFIEEMEKEVPGIFEKIDGWSSHSYPNPDFSGSPQAVGRGTIRTFQWELNVLQTLNVKKNLPIFITETGWKHSEGLSPAGYPSPEVVGNYYKTAFESAWGDSRIAAVTPFLLNYQQAPFDHFSFKKLESKQNGEEKNVLGEASSKYYEHYDTVSSMPKQKGLPNQIKKAELLAGEVPKTLVAGEKYTFNFTFQNVGQSIWNEYEPAEVRPVNESKDLVFESFQEQIAPVEPQTEQTFTITIKPETLGSYDIKFNLFSGSAQFDNDPFIFPVEVKLPVILSLKTTLPWKKDNSGPYTLVIKTKTQSQEETIILDINGNASSLVRRRLLPDTEYEITIKRPYYVSKTVKQTLVSGENAINFGTLIPNFLSALFSPKDFWQLLPFSG